ncbi:MAG TPA: lysophospholipid acyltransferase family protein [Rhodanobacteraceae bacterium]|nr:lysophospholipid acyltransferase family protein [Rhodanobacteraceae bacterium]
MATTGLDTTNPPWRRLGWAGINALQLVYTLIFSAAGITLALLALLACGGRPWLPLRMAAWLWAPGLMLGAGARWRVYDVDAVDWTQPCVLVANHQSEIDICALFRAVPVPLRFVLKQELARMPFLGWYTRAMGMLFIDRGHSREAARSLHHAAAMVRDGAVVCVFPEGTRSPSGRLGTFKGGAFQLAIEAGVPVVPVAIRGSGMVLPRGGFRVRPGLIELRFGTPIATAGLTTADRHTLTTQARDAVQDLLRRSA